MFYEALVLAALLLLAGLPLTLFARQLDPLLTRPIIQAGSLLVTGFFFCWFWTHGGQTLPMKTWRIRLVAADGGTVSWSRAGARFLAAVITVPLAGIGLLWALVDPQRRFLHDRIANTRIVPAPNTAA